MIAYLHSFQVLKIQVLKLILSFKNLKIKLEIGTRNSFHLMQSIVNGFVRQTKWSRSGDKLK